MHLVMYMHCFRCDFSSFFCLLSNISFLCILTSSCNSRQTSSTSCFESGKINAKLIVFSALIARKTHHFFLPPQPEMRKWIERQKCHKSWCIWLLCNARVLMCVFIQVTTSTGPCQTFAVGSIPYNHVAGSLAEGRFIVDLGHNYAIGALMVENAISLDGVAKVMFCWHTNHMAMCEYQLCAPCAHANHARVDMCI